MTDINKKYFENRNKDLLNRKKENIYKRHESSIKTINCLLKASNLKEINNDSILLDVGSGDGSLINYLSSKKISCDGCDINDANLEIDPLPFQNSSFTHVLLYSVIEHIKNTNHIIEEIKRVLKNDGILIIITPNFRYSYDTFYDDPTHVKPFTDKGIFELLKITNFCNISVKPWTTNAVNFIWKLPFSFFYCAKILPFRNDDRLYFIPSFLKGKSQTLIAVCQKI